MASQEPKTAAALRRPIAPLFPIAFATVLGVVIDRRVAPCTTTTWAATAVLASLASLFALRRSRLGSIAVLLAWTTVAAAWHHRCWTDLAPDDLARFVDETPRPAWVRGVVREAEGYRPGSGEDDSGVTRAVVDVTAIHARGRWRNASGRAMVSVKGDRPDVQVGLDVEATGSLALVAAPLNPGEFDYQSHLRARGVRLRLSITDPEGFLVAPDTSPRPRSFSVLWIRTVGALRAWSQARLAKAIEPAAFPLASALLLGRREGVDPTLNDAFARTGTSHLIAVSGLHMQALALALGGLLRLTGLGRRPTLAAVGLASLAYALLIGLMPSVTRSAAMTTAFCLAGLVDRKSRPGDNLALAAIVTLAIHPAHLFDVGCQLSFLAVGVIVWLLGPLNRLLTHPRELDPLTAVERAYEPAWRKWPRRACAWFVEGLVLSTAVWLAAWPLVALRFHMISPIGVLLNIPLIPITSAALLAAGLTLFLSTLLEPLARPFGWAAARLLDWTEQTVRWGAKHPWGHAYVPEPSSAWVLGFYLALALVAAAQTRRWRRRSLANGLLGAWSALGLILGVAPALLHDPDAPPNAEVLAVGHGLAVVIETGAGRAVLYDCGRMRDPSVGRRLIAPALRARGIHRLDAVILSHADDDHFNGLPDLLDLVPIAAVLIPDGFTGSPVNPGAVALLDLVRSRGVPVRVVPAGESWDVGSTHFLVRHPALGWMPFAPDNARSLVLDVSWRGRHALLTGDLDGPGLDALLGSPPPLPIPLDVLLAPHHGGKTANPARLYDALAPSLVVVSQRPPTPGARDPLQFLERRGLDPWRTWSRGAVRLAWTPSGLRATGFRDPNP